MHFRKHKLIKSLLWTSGLLLLIAAGGAVKTTHYASASSNVQNKINRQVNHMSYRQRLSQLFVIEMGNNTSANNRYLRKYRPGGVLLMGDNFTSSRANDRARIRSMQRASDNSLLVGTDVEGGEVNRLGYVRPYPHYLSPSQEYSQHGLKGINKEYNAIGKNMRGLGLNWDYAPDADPSNGYMSFRTVKRGPYTTAKYVRTAVHGLQNHKVAATVKHYPGYRGSRDTDFYPTYSGINRKTYRNDLIPFNGANNSDSIMTNSVVYRKLSKAPANLSKQIIMPLHNRYQGVIITDSLGTGAIRHYTRSADYDALRAGNTMVMSDDLPSKLNFLVKDMRKGYLNKNLINNDVKRVLVMKYKLGLNY